MKYLDLGSFFAKVLKPRRLGKLASLDFGTKHVGVAITDASRAFVVPHSTLARTKPPAHRMSRTSVQTLGQNLQNVIDNEQICGIVVGLPLKDGETTLFCKEIVDVMLRMNCNLPTTTDNITNDITQVPFTLWDEYASTMDSRRLVAATSNKRSVYLKKKDSMAASVILQKFLANYDSATANANDKD